MTLLLFFNSRFFNSRLNINFPTRLFFTRRIMNVGLILFCQYTEIIKWITELAIAFEIFSIGIAIFAEFVYVLQLFCVTICWYKKTNVKPRLHYIHSCAYAMSSSFRRYYLYFEKTTEIFYDNIWTNKTIMCNWQICTFSQWRFGMQVDPQRFTGNGNVVRLSIALSQDHLC